MLIYLPNHHAQKNHLDIISVVLFRQRILSYKSKISPKNLLLKAYAYSKLANLCQADDLYCSKNAISLKKQSIPSSFHVYLLEGFQSTEFLQHLKSLSITNTKSQLAHEGYWLALAKEVGRI